MAVSRSIWWDSNEPNSPFAKFGYVLTGNYLDCRNATCDDVPNGLDQRVPRVAV